MTLNERIRSLRKTLNLSGEKFGARIGVKKNTVSQWENGKNITEQAFKSICREFNVNESWLRAGEGSMFRNLSIEDEFKKAVTDICSKKDVAAMQAIIGYWKMEESEKKSFWDNLLEIAEVYKHANCPEKIQAERPTLTSEEIDARVEEYRQELELEARVAAKSEAFRNTRKNA